MLPYSVSGNKGYIRHRHCHHYNTVEALRTPPHGLCPATPNGQSMLSGRDKVSGHGCSTWRCHPVTPRLLVLLGCLGVLSGSSWSCLCGRPSCNFVTDETTRGVNSPARVEEHNAGLLCMLSTAVTHCHLVATLCNTCYNSYTHYCVQHSVFARYTSLSFLYLTLRHTLTSY